MKISSPPPLPPYSPHHHAASMVSTFLRREGEEGEEGEREGGRGMVLNDTKSDSLSVRELIWQISSVYEQQTIPPHQCPLVRGREGGREKRIGLETRIKSPGHTAVGLPVSLPQSPSSMTI